MRARTSRLEFFQAPMHPELQAAFLDAVASAGAGTRHVVLLPARALGVQLVRAHARRFGATLDLKCVTWTELALELTAPERWSTSRRLLTPEAPVWLLRRLRERGSRAANYFDAMLEVRGFRLALRRSFEELGRAGLARCAEVERLLVQHGTELPLKLRHALDLYLAYRRLFEFTHDDTSSLLAHAATVPAGRFGACFGTRELWMYGSAEVAALERRLLRHLAQDPELEVRVFVPCTSDVEPRLGRDLEPMGFVPARAAVPFARRMPAEVHALSTPGEESEADEIARQVLAAAGKGVPFREMAVIARRTGRLDLVRTALERCGVPVALATPRALQSCRAGRALLFFLDLLDAGLTPQPVMSFLCLAPLRWRHWAGLHDDAVPTAWERVAGEARLGVGLEDWTHKLRRLRQDLEARAGRLDAEGEPASRARASARAANELLLLARALHRDLSRVPERAHWGDFVAAIQSVLETAFEPGPDIDALQAALSRLRSLDVLGEVKLHRSDFRDAMRHLLAEAPLQDGSFQDRDGVRLGSAAALHGLDFEVVCLAGLQEGEWPSPGREDPVLLESDRERLASLLGDPEALPPRVRVTERDRRLFWAAAGAARNRLVLSYARLDPSTGASRLPSTLLLELAGEREARSLDFAGLESLPWVERVPLRRTSLPSGAPVLGLSEHDTLAVARLGGRAARRYVMRLGGTAAAGLWLDLMRNERHRFTAVDGMLRSPEARAALQARFASQPWSVTQLATWATCPFRFFARHVLRIEPFEHDDRREPSDLEIGKLVHRILERFYAGLNAEGRARHDRAQFAELRQRLQEVAEGEFGAAEMRGLAGAPLLWSIRKQRLREDLTRFLRHELQRNRAWLPQDFEREFGRGGSLAPQLARPDGAAIQLVGTIDRLDVHPEHDGVRVVDYKSGRAPRGGTRSPQTLQLLVYLWAATGGDPERLRHSEGRFLYVTRRGEFALQRLPGGVLVDRRADFERLLSDVVRGIEAGEFFPQPGPGAESCKACDYQSLCEARVAEQVEVKTGAGQTQRFRDLPDFAPELETLALGTQEPDVGRD